MEGLSAAAGDMDPVCDLGTRAILAPRRPKDGSDHPSDRRNEQDHNTPRHRYPRQIDLRRRNKNHAFAGLSKLRSPAPTVVTTVAFQKWVLFFDLKSKQLTGHPFPQRALREVVRFVA
jgi:hypothetical protein